jgi:predicted transcriptional regulator
MLQDMWKRGAIMSHASKILQNMKANVYYRPEDLYHLGIQPKQVAEVLKHLVAGGVVDCEDEGYRKRKVYKTKQKDLFEAASQSIIDNARR